MRAKDSRNAKIRRMKAAGKTNSEIAKQYGITLARVNQILKIRGKKGI